jgi:FG-GAP repeat
LEAPIDGEAQFGYLGWSVSISADASRVVVGAPHHTDQGLLYSGTVRVFQRVNESSWQQVGNTITGNSFGWSVDISDDGSRVAVGAPQDDNGSGLLTAELCVYSSK